MCGTCLTPPPLWKFSLFKPFLYALFCFFADYKIKARHELLARTIGAKQEEEASLSASNTLVITATIAIIVCSVLEVALYRLYNRKVDFYIIYLSYLQS